MAKPLAYFHFHEIVISLFLWVMLYLCPDAHGVLLVDQEVSTPKPVVRNAPCQAREVLDTVCWGPLYV